MSAVDPETADLLVDHFFYAGQESTTDLLALLLTHESTPPETLYFSLRRLGDYGIAVTENALVDAITSLIRHEHDLVSLEAIRTTALIVPNGIDLIMAVFSGLDANEHLKTKCFFEVNGLIFNRGVTSDQSSRLFEQQTC